MQLDDNSDNALLEKLTNWCFNELPDVHEEPSQISPLQPCE